MRIFNLRTNDLALLLLIFLFLTLSYLPALTNHYIHHDDVKFFLKTSTNNFVPDFYQNAFIGRPLGAIRLTLSNLFINHLSDLLIFRWINVLLMTLCAWLLFLKLQNYYPNKSNALFASVIIFTLPPFQILATFLGMCITPLALLMALLSDKYKHKLLFSIFLLLISMLIYPPCAFFFWIMLLLELLSIHSNKPDLLLKKSIPYFKTGFGGMLLYCIYLWMTKPIFGQIGLPGYDPYNLKIDFVSKFIWVLKEPLLNALNLWNIFPSILWASVALFFIALATIIHLTNKNFTQQLKTTKGLIFCITWILLIVLLIILCSIPYIASSVPFGFYRCLAPLSGLIAVILLWSIDQWLIVIPDKFRSKTQILILSFTLVIAICMSYQNLFLNRVYPSVIEYQFVRNSIKEHVNEQQLQIQFQRPDLKKIRSRYDEFGTPTSFYTHNFIALIALCLRDLNDKSFDLEKIIYDFEQSEFDFIFSNGESLNKIYTIHLTYEKESDKPLRMPNKKHIVVNLPEIYEAGQPLAYLIQK